MTVTFFYFRQVDFALKASAGYQSSLAIRSFLKSKLLKPCRWLMFFVVLFIQSNLHAQSYEKLIELKGHKAAIYFSSGAKAKAERMGLQIDKVMAFYATPLQFTPTVTLLVLSPQDWSTYTKFPFYGMPHYNSNKTLIVASEDNDFWRSQVPAIDKMPDALARQFKATYLNQKGALTMEPFFDLLAIHELGHAYTSQGGLVTQRRWMGELFPNIMLHTYIAENEPTLLPALTVFPKMVVATTDRSILKYTTLAELEANYNELGQKHPQNYGWYQCRWHVAAGVIYDAGKIHGVKRLWETLKGQKAVLNDAELTELLKLKADKSVADVLVNWDRL